MDKTVSAAEANRTFSRILRSVREGDTYVVTSHGRPVARISPFTRQDEERAAAFARLIARLEQQPAIDIGHWTRDELYEDD